MVAMTFSMQRFMLWLAFLLLTLVVALSLSWLVLAKVDFAYPLLHDHAGLGKNIEQYAPRNLTRPYFDLTTPAERARLFHEIVTAIHHRGHGLSELRYHDDQGRLIATLLTPAEVVHLQDVAHLLDKLKIMALLALPLWAGMFMTLVWLRQPLPSSRHLLLGLAGVGAVTAVILALGAERVFYQLHVWVFPAGHQWFFFYEESLMSTMMKAPDLFGYIAVMLAVLALSISLGLLWLYQRVVRHRLSG